MENIQLPTKVELTKGKNNEYTATVEPCYPGYGTTLGNALRRVLLSSLAGAAITDVKISNASHEFTTIPHVKEDILDIILNLKKLKFKIYTDELVKLKLYVKGEKKVTAADIEKNAEVELADTNFHIATLTDKNAELDMELVIRHGRGASSIEEREKKDREIGLIAVDAIFSPIKVVGYKIENVRVGQQTNYEKLILTFETDGSINGDEAMREATQILVDHFNVILGVEKATRAPKAEAKPEKKSGGKKDEKTENNVVETSAKKKSGRPKKK